MSRPADMGISEEMMEHSLKGPREENAVRASFIICMFLSFLGPMSRPADMGISEEMMEHLTADELAHLRTTLTAPPPRCLFWYTY